MNDLRIPIGAFFSIAGVVLCVTGVATGYRARLEPDNVNLYCGILILVFGAVMLWLARRKSTS